MSRLWIWTSRVRIPSLTPIFPKSLRGNLRRWKNVAAWPSALRLDRTTAPAAELTKAMGHESREPTQPSY